MISIIVAIAANGMIGCHNRLLWHIREDLQFFKRTTAGHPVVMGRRTFDSLGRPLPGRRNVVVTRQSDWRFDGVETVHSLEQALALFDPREEVFIIGGAQIYAQALPLADRLYITRVEKEYEGDTVFPAFETKDWRLVFTERHDRGEMFEHPFRFEMWERK